MFILYNYVPLSFYYKNGYVMWNLKKYLNLYTEDWNKICGNIRFVTTDVKIIILPGEIMHLLKIFSQDMSFYIVLKRLDNK